MPTVPAVQSANEGSTAGTGVPHRPTPPGHDAVRVCYRLGDAWLDLESDCRPLLDAFDALHRDAEVRDAGTPTIRCHATRPPGSPFLEVSFDDRPAADLFEVTHTFLRLVRVRPSCRQEPAPGGWTQLVDTARGRPVIATKDETALVDIDLEGPIFWAQQLLTVVQRAQPQVVFLHAASVGVGGRGALLIGPSYGGKTTTALTLAWRGHSLLGDDIAAVRLPTREILPFRQAFGVREGPLPQDLRDRLGSCPHTVQDGVNGEPQRVVHFGDLLPAPPDALPLAFAFVLNRSANGGALRPFSPGLGDTRQLKALSTGMIVAWGPTAGSHVMRFLSVVHLLSTLKCFVVDLGSPAATAGLIEEVMLEQCS